MPRRRRIKAAKITHISLVPRGANRMPVIYKADSQMLDLDMLVKAGEDFMEKGELTAIVYAPESRDSQGDIASADVIKEMMYDAARDGVEIDLRHDGAALNKDQAFVAESFIVQKGDPRFDGIKDYEGNAVDPTGAWGVVMKIDDPVLRQKYRDGEWNGVSMGGTAVVESEKSADDVERVLAGMAKLLNGGDSDTNTEGDFDMDAKELAAALKESNDSLAKSIVDGVKEAITEVLPSKKQDDAATNDKPEETKKQEIPAPIFKGDPTNEEDVLNFQKKLALHKIRTETDWSDPASVGEYLAKMAEFKEEFGDIEPEQTPKSRRTAKTSQPVNKGESPDFVAEGVSKEDMDCFSVGSEIAKWANEQRGLSPQSA